MIPIHNLYFLLSLGIMEHQPRSATSQVISPMTRLQRGYFPHDKIVKATSLKEHYFKDKAIQFWGSHKS